MALSVPRLTLTIEAAFVAGGASPLSPLLASMSSALAQAIIDEIKFGDVDPTTGTPPMTSPSGAVTGKGKIT